MNAVACIVTGSLLFCLTPALLAAEISPPPTGQPDSSHDGPMATVSVPTRPAVDLAQGTGEQQHNAKVLTPRRNPPLPLRRSGDRSGSAATTQDDGPKIGSLWTALTATSFILLLIMGLAKLLKKHVPMGTATLPQEALEVLGKRQLDPRQRIYVVRCGSRILLIGSCADGLTALAEITDPVEVDCLAGLCRQEGQDTAVVRTFRQLFNLREPSAVPESADTLSSIASRIDRDRAAQEMGTAALGPATKAEQVHG